MLRSSFNFFLFEFWNIISQSSAPFFPPSLCPADFAACFSYSLFRVMCKFHVRICWSKQPPIFLWKIHFTWSTAIYKFQVKMDKLSFFLGNSIIKYFVLIGLRYMHYASVHRRVRTDRRNSSSELETHHVGINGADFISWIVACGMTTSKIDGSWLHNFFCSFSIFQTAVFIAATALYKSTDNNRLRRKVIRHRIFSVCCCIAALRLVC